jgi:two-component system LytT family response regulator
MKTLLIDDERLARKELSSLLADFEQVEIVGECQNADEAKLQIETLKPDLIFLDIQMPGKSGFDLLDELDYVPRVIFVTAFDEYAIKAFEVNALDYLLKPVEPQRLESALSRIKEEMDNEQEQNKRQSDENDSFLRPHNQIFLKDGERCWLVTLSDVRMFESEGNYVRVYFENNKPLILKSLNNLESRLDPKAFFRVNRKFIVNLRCIEKIEPWFNGGLQVTLSTGEKAEVSRRQTARFKELMSL